MNGSMTIQINVLKFTLRWTCDLEYIINKLLDICLKGVHFHSNLKKVPGNSGNGNGSIPADSWHRNSKPKLSLTEAEFTTTSFIQLVS